MNPAHPTICIEDEQIILEWPERKLVFPASYSGMVKALGYVPVYHSETPEKMGQGNFPFKPEPTKRGMVKVAPSTARRRTVANFSPDLKSAAAAIVRGMERK